MKMDETEDVIFFANTQPAFIISKPVEKASFVNTLKVNSTNDDISKDRRTLIEKSSSLLFSLGSTIKRKGRDNNFQKI